MTIPAYNNRASYAGDGVTTAFAFTPPFTANLDLVVAVKNSSGVFTTLVLGTDYTVTGALNPSGGVITIPATVPIGSTLIILRKVPPTQTLNLQDGGPQPAAGMNGSLDRRAMIEQYLLDMVSRAITQNQLDDGTGPFVINGLQVIGAADATIGSGLVTLQQMAVAISTGVIGPSGSVTKRQVVLALVDATNPGGANMLPTVNNSADPQAGDAGSAEWYAGSPMAPNDALYNLIATATGWNGTQMTAFLVLARSKPV